jgi:SNF2 family DNA or RNA helicase
MGGDLLPNVGADGFSWEAPARPSAWAVDLQLAPRPWCGNRAVQAFDAARATPPRPAVYTIGLGAERPRIVSVPIRRSEVRVRSFSFAPQEEAANTGATDVAGGAGGTGSCILGPSGANTPTSATRIRPPVDLVKIEDRLSYLLEPPLESLLAERSLGFPFQPFPFQLEGIAFLYPRHAAVLADEMGLGKTMQAITAVRLLLRCGVVRSVLLVCPKPLVSNWRREFDLWAPEVPVMAIEGDQARRAWQWRLPDVPVRIANYEILVRDREVLEGGKGDRGGKGDETLLCEAPSGSCRQEGPVPFSPRFDLVILDEAQRVKNRSSATSGAARSISRRRSWALTGTPVENSTDDLVGIFEFLAPGFLSPEMKPRRMGRAVGDYVLRRTKEQVLTDLPPKLVRDAELELTPAQRESYGLAEQQGVVQLSGLGTSLSIQHVFELVLRLKQICNFDPASGASSKLERLAADLEEIAASGRKAIVFSQWVQTLRRLALKLARFGPLEYHGRVPARERDRVIRRFRDDPDKHVMLVSYGAGGVGLNLQFAGYVFLFDRWWNPAVEDQAINRAHRIGAAGPVTVTRFLVLDTIEQRIDRILQEKRDLFELVLAGTERRGKLSLTEEELFGLFDLTGPDGPVKLAA